MSIKDRENKKLTEEDIDKVRHMEGFPIGSDEDIIALSNPPYYTACPNPFIQDFINKHGKPYNEENDSYQRMPFSADISEGKNDPIYNVHTYHTKVPHKAIMRYILHYTEPGDIVFDGFCGTGMTGVAAQLCGNPEEEFRYVIEQEMKNVKWGKRKAILNDLSPAATFIAKNYNLKCDIEKFASDAENILAELERKYKWMYETNHTDTSDINMYNDKNNAPKGEIIYTVWSDVFICPNCNSEIIFYEAAAEENTGKVNDVFDCKNCGINLKKKDCENAVELLYDDLLKQKVTVKKTTPVLIKYRYGKKSYIKVPDINDFENIEKINKITINSFVPTSRMIDGKETRRNDKFGMTHAHHFYTKKTIIILSEFYNKIIASDYAKDLLMLLFTSQIINISKMNRFRPQVSFPYNPLSGTMYISSLTSEANIFRAYNGKIDRIIKAHKYFDEGDVIISTSSSSKLNIEDNSIDYIFTDPPFGSNLNYSELSHLWETWLKNITNNKEEAIINSSQMKGLAEYQNLMSKCFSEFYRVLKPNRWITVEFSNSQNSVWNAIQESLLKAGFVVADVRSLDKKTGSFKQVNTVTAVKQDLIISAYKPVEKVKKAIIMNNDSEKGVWLFIENHLNKLPIIVESGGCIEVIKEREKFVLFDRMIAFHVMNGLSVPTDASSFYKGLDENFICRDGMYFTHEQVCIYDAEKDKREIEPIQYSMFITDERTAIAWLYKKLIEPLTYSDIQPDFIKDMYVEKHEKLPELKHLLEENFLKDDNGRWFIADRSNEADLIKLREKRLLKEFEEYFEGKGKLKLFRTEAIRVGFSKLWKDKDYKKIIQVANRLPDIVIQEDDKLLMYYDISLSRVE